VDDFFPFIKYYDFFGNNCFTISNDDESWEFVKIYKKYGGEMQNLASYGQSCCVFFTNDILKKVTEEILQNSVLYSDMLSELRCGTIVNKFTTIKKARDDIRDFVWWNNTDLVFGKGHYFYHPIKGFDDFNKYV
jgi:hypothetical protein